MSTCSTALADTGYRKNIMDIESETIPVKAPPANKKLSESRLRMAAIQTPPTFVEAEITLKEAVCGTNRNFKINDQLSCTNCVNEKPINRLHCPECKGLGYSLAEREITVDLAAGLLPDQEITLTGSGALDYRSGKNGDLIVKIKLIEHPYLKVEGKNITYSIPVTLYDAVLGAEVEVPTINGKVIMKIQPLTQFDRVYRLKGLGIDNGDQLVTIEVVMPQTLNKKQVQLFRQIKEIAEQSNQPENQ